MTHELIQPTKEMLDAGVEDLLQQVPCLEDDLGYDELQDVVCFVWQAMLGKAPQVTSDEIAEQQGVDPAITDAYMQLCHDAEARMKAPVVPTFDEWCAATDIKPVGWVKEAMREAYDGCRASARPTVVPDEATADGVIGMHECGFVEGWNACRAAMLKKPE